MTKVQAKKSSTQAKQRWVITGIPKSLQQAVTDAANDEGVSVGEFVEQALKNQKVIRKPKIDASKIKSLKDVTSALTKIEKRLSAVESGAGYIHLKRNHMAALAEKINVKELYEKMHLKEAYEKGNSFLSRAYQYAKDKCVGVPKKKVRKKSTRSKK